MALGPTRASPALKPRPLAEPVGLADVPVRARALARTRALALAVEVEVRSRHGTAAEPPTPAVDTPCAHASTSENRCVLPPFGRVR